MSDNIPDLNLFMMCKKVNIKAYSEIPNGFTLRTLRKDELEIWKRFPFDNEEEKEKYSSSMQEYFDKVYAKKSEDFFSKCFVICNNEDIPVATCFAWRAYNEITTIHWLKVRKSCEDRGLGRAIMTVVMQGINEENYPVYLHTHPSCYRAIKLYSDFGFALVKSEGKIGTRENDLEKALPILEEYMPESAYQGLNFENAPVDFIETVEKSDIDEF